MNVFKRAAKKIIAVAHAWRDDTRDILRDAWSSRAHWREWTADYHYLARSRARNLLALARARTRRLVGGETSDAVTHRGRDVVVLPGIYETAADLEPITRRLRAEGHHIVVVAGMGRQLFPMPWLRRRVETTLRNNEIDDAILLAHSKGGLIGKEVLMGEDGERVAGLIAIAAPWHGSRYAALFWPGLGVRSLRPGSPLLAEINVPHVSDARIVSLSPSFDPHLPLGSTLAGATNIPVQASGHFQVLGDPDVVALVTDLVNTWESRHERHTGH